MFQSKPTHKVAKSLSKNKQCAKKVPKPPLPAVSEASFVNDSKEAHKAELFAPKEEPTALLENKGSLSLQNIERNRLSGFHEAFFQGRNTRDKSETADKNG